MPCVASAATSTPFAMPACRNSLGRLPKQTPLSRLAQRHQNLLRYSPGKAIGDEVHGARDVPVREVPSRAGFRVRHDSLGRHKVTAGKRSSVQAGRLRLRGIRPWALFI